MADIFTLRSRAATGDPNAQFRLARRMLIGVELPFAPDEAMRLVGAACAQKYPLALLFHATLAALGIARPQSFDDAIAYVSEAAATGYERARGQLEALGGVEKFDPSDWLSVPPQQQHFVAPRISTIEAFLPKQVCDWHIKQAGLRLAARGGQRSPARRPGG